MIDAQTADRFLSFVHPEPNTGCWLWSGGAVPFGYGSFSVRRRHVRAHRFSYAMYVGPIPYGQLVCHRCDVPSCVNPDHLFLGTHRENIRDAITKGRANFQVHPEIIRENGRRRAAVMPRYSGEQNGNSKLTKEAVGDIRSSAESRPVLAARYGVSLSLITAVRHRKVWR